MSKSEQLGLEGIAARVFGNIRGILDGENPQVADEATRLCEERYKFLEPGKAVSVSYDIPYADYGKAAEAIEKRINGETHLELLCTFHPSGGSNTPIIYSSKEEIDGVTVSVSILRDDPTLGKDQLLFNFWGEGLTGKLVEDRYQGLMDQIHSIVLTEAKNYQKKA